MFPYAESIFHLSAIKYKNFFIKRQLSSADSTKSTVIDEVFNNRVNEIWNRLILIMYIL